MEEERERFDVIVLGVGGFGSAALDHVARRGYKVLGLERAAAVGHDRGSSHGETRIVRRAYFEHPDYVPLLARAYDLWDALDAGRGAPHGASPLLVRCGLVLAGPAHGEAIAGARLAAERHRDRVALEDVALGDARRRFPGLVFTEADDVVFERDAGFLHVENAVRAHVARAVRHGARVVTGDEVVSWRAFDGYVGVATRGATYYADRLILTAGAWTAPLLPPLAPHLTVLRKTMLWFPRRSPDHDVARAPAFYFERADGAFYGFPSIDGATVKVAEHTGGEPVADPAELDRALHPADVARVAAFVAGALRSVDPRPVRHAACMYTMSPDQHFVVDRHPAHPEVVFGAGFSGHGFKFTPVIGEALADLACDGRTALPIGFLGAARLGAGGGASP